MQQTQLNKTKIVGWNAKINSKDKHYYWKPINHLSSNLKLKQENIKDKGAFTILKIQKTHLYLRIKKNNRTPPVYVKVRYTGWLNNQNHLSYVDCHTASSPGPGHLSTQGSSLFSHEMADAQKREKLLLPTSCLEMLQKRGVSTTSWISMGQFNGYTWK